MDVQIADPACCGFDCVLREHLVFVIGDGYMASPGSLVCHLHGCIYVYLRMVTFKYTVVGECA